MKAGRAEQARVVVKPRPARAGAVTGGDGARRRKGERDGTRQGVHRDGVLTLADGARLVRARRWEIDGGLFGRRPPTREDAT